MVINGNHERIYKHMGVKGSFWEKNSSKIPLSGNRYRNSSPEKALINKI